MGADAIYTLLPQDVERHASSESVEWLFSGDADATLIYRHMTALACSKLPGQNHPALHAQTNQDADAKRIQDITAGLHFLLCQANMQQCVAQLAFCCGHTEQRGIRVFR